MAKHLNTVVGFLGVLTATSGGIVPEYGLAYAGGPGGLGYGGGGYGGGAVGGYGGGGYGGGAVGGYGGGGYGGGAIGGYGGGAVGGYGGAAVGGYGGAANGLVYGPGIGKIGGVGVGLPLVEAPIVKPVVPYAGIASYAKPVVEPVFAHHVPHGYGGEEIDKTVFGGGKKALTGEHYEKLDGKKGEEFNHGGGGFHEGKTLVKDVKGDTVYYGDVAEGKKVEEDAKLYHGGKHFDKEGKAGEEKKVSHGHKKGHVVKGFKNSHHKDETGHAEEYYDEDHDEGGEAVFGGNFGSFGENGASSFKGGHEDGQLYAGEQKKSGHYGSEHLVDREGADHGKYGGNRFHGNGAVYGKNNGVDEHSLQGHQESERVLKHKPFYHHFY